MHATSWGTSASIRRMSWTALVMAAVLGSGTALADECSDAWDDASAADHCDDAGDSVTVQNAGSANTCSVDVACYVSVDLLNGPSGQTITGNTYVITPLAWEVRTDGAGNTSGTGVARSDVSNITICYYQGSLTGAQWVDWRDKFSTTSCASDEVDVDTAVADGLDLRTSAN